MPNPTSSDPLIGSTFGFTIDGSEIAAFTSVSGISIEFEVIEHRQTLKDGKSRLIKFPGAVKYSEITLKRGISDNKVLNDWMKEVVSRGAEPAKKTAAITCYDQTYQPVATFNFEGCWPSKLTASDLSASANEVMVEEITIQHQEIHWA